MSKKLPKKQSKINFKNFKSTNSFLMIWITVLRIMMVVFSILAPIFIVLSYYFDLGMQVLTGYVFTTFFPDQTNTGNAYSYNAELFRFIITPILWFISSIIIFFAGLIPYFSKNTYKKRVILAINQFFWPLFFIGVLWGVWFSVRFFPSGPESDINATIYPRYEYWSLLINNDSFSPWSGWMIFYQCVLLIWIFFAIFTAIEASLIKKHKLDFSDFFKKEIDYKSLVHQVVEGNIVFGEQKYNNETKKRLKELEIKENMLQKQRHEELIQKQKIEKRSKKKNKEADSNAKTEEKSKL